jgi:hypothetical protein
MEEWLQHLIQGFGLVILGVICICFYLVDLAHIGVFWFPLSMFTVGCGVGCLAVVYSVYKFEKKVKD